MKLSLLTALLFVSTCSLLAENKTTQTPMTMQQLMRELQVQGGNFVFEFDTPVYARITAVVTQYPKGKEEKYYFDTSSANKKVELYFTASPLLLGQYPRGNVSANACKMLIHLSDCKETNGTRIIPYYEKFTENLYRKNGAVASYDPNIPAIPQTDKDYILFWYFQDGDPYYAKATIRFSSTPFKKE